MYLHTDNIKRVADACRKEELQASLKDKLRKYKFDSLDRATYVNRIVQELSSCSLSYLNLLNIACNGSPPDRQSLKRICRDISQKKTRERVYRRPGEPEFDLEGCVRHDLRCADFSASKVVSFMDKQVQRYKDERLKELDSFCYSAIEERAKTEQEVMRMYDDCVLYLTVVERVAKKENNERVRSEVNRARSKAWENFETSRRTMQNLKQELALFAPHTNLP